MSIDGPQKYVPTEKEIKKGEDTMTDAQKEFGAKREESAIKLKAMGVEGYLVEGYLNKYAVVDAEISTININGVMNGHKIDMYMSNRSSSSPYKGTIDNQDLTNDELEAFFMKYGDKMVFHSPEAFKAAADVGGSKRKQSLKDIGL